MATKKAKPIDKPKDYWTVKDAPSHPDFHKFVAWAEENGVDVHGHPDDWITWWECFFSGIIAGMT